MYRRYTYQSETAIGVGTETTQHKIMCQVYGICNHLLTDLKAFSIMKRAKSHHALTSDKACTVVINKFCIRKVSCVLPATC
jgi:hypothetical protein